MIPARPDDEDATPTIFGTPWGPAPVHRWPRPPAYTRCTRCGEPIQPTDNGFIRRPTTMIAADYVVGADDDGPLTAIHRECDLAEWIGHVVGVDNEHYWDTSRASAREAERRWHQLIRTQGESVVGCDPPPEPPEEP